MLELISLDFDSRLQATCALAKCSYRWFIAATSGAEENLKIQRKIISGTKAYATLRADLKRGCVLPPPVLAVKSVDCTMPRRNVEPAELERIDELLRPVLEAIAPENTYIIDGLQRTNAIRQAAEELAGDEREAFLDRALRVELWINIPFGALAYRMLLLNAGQRPMSIKHQVEILSMKLKEELSTISGIDIFTSIEGRRRRQPGQFQLAKLSQAFQAWLQGQPNIDLKNTVMEQLLAENAIDVLGADVTDEVASGEKEEGFKRLVTWINRMDHLTTEDALEFFSSDTVLLGLSAAVGAAERNADLRPRMELCLTKLLGLAESSSADAALGIADFNLLRAGIDATKRNVGEATRDLVFYAFQEHFLSAGSKPMVECWRFAAGRS